MKKSLLRVCAALCIVLFSTNAIMALPAKDSMGEDSAAVEVYSEEETKDTEEIADTVVETDEVPDVSATEEYESSVPSSRINQPDDSDNDDQVLAVLEEASENGASVEYQTYIQGGGWQTPVKDGATSGTEGQSKRTEGIKIILSNSLYDGLIRYRAYMQSTGWQPEAVNGEQSGITGQSKRMEAIQIRMTGEIAEYFDIYYRAHVQSFGWLGWAKNGETAGSTDLAYRLEALQIRLIPKNATPPTSDRRPYEFPVTLQYSAHMQSAGWQSYVRSGSTAGSAGQGKRLEALKIGFSGPGLDGNVQYNAHVQGIGWQGWAENDQISGTVGQARRMEAIRIRLTGTVGNEYDVFYRSNVEGFGWLGWAKNGEDSGTVGYSNRLEAIQIVLCRKGYVPQGYNANQIKVVSISFPAGVNAAEKQIAKRVNILRYQRGVAPLTWSSTLHRSAQIRAKESESRFSHTRPNGTSWSTVLSENGYRWGDVGENIAKTTFSTPDDAAMGDYLYNLWVNSPSHYENMIKSSYREMGMAVYKSGNTTYGCQVFGRPQ